jgi:negative regulator of sigma E activity
VRCQDYLAIERFPIILKQQQQQQQQQQQHWKINMKLCGFPKIEQAMKMGKIEGSAKDSGTMMRDESKEDSDDGKL